MKFGLFYELSVPRPWTRESERAVYDNALEQVVLATAVASVEKFDLSGNNGPYGSASQTQINQMLGIPGNSALSFIYSGTALSAACAGKTTTLDQTNTPGRPKVFSASLDGRTGLVTFLGGAGIDVYQVLADGRLQSLSSDGVTSLAQWRPGG